MKLLIFDDFTKSKFDDFEKDDNIECCHLWSQICNECVKFYNIGDDLLDSSVGSSICGIIGCSNVSDHYLDFPSGQIFVQSNLLFFCGKKFYAKRELTTN